MGRPQLVHTIWHTHFWKATHSTDLLTAWVVIKLSAGAYIASLHAGVLHEHIGGAEVAGKEGPCDALSHTRMEQPLLIDLLHHDRKLF